MYTVHVHCLYMYMYMYSNYIVAHTVEPRLPFGGSLVTFTEFCSTDTGKALVGMEERNSLKSSCMNVSGEENSFTVLSIDNIHEAAK